MDNGKLTARLSIISLGLSLVLLFCTIWLWRDNATLRNEINTVGAANTQVSASNDPQLEKRVAALEDKLKSNSDSQAKNETEKSSDKTLYYLSKLGDKTFTAKYNNNEYTWYIAAEELGKIGKDAIPLLVENLKTGDPYEKSLTFYALQLASQNDNVKAFTKGEYINVKYALSFDEAQFAEMSKIVDTWWNKYKNNF